MLRLHPKTVQNRVFLSRLLEYYLVMLQDSPHQVSLRNLAWDTRIPESVLLRLLHYYRTPEDEGVMTSEDFHIAFANIMVHYPTVRLWWDVDGQVYVSM
jgi:hypothetical protein